MVQYFWYTFVMSEDAVARRREQQMLRDINKTPSTTINSKQEGIGRNSFLKLGAAGLAGLAFWKTAEYVGDLMEEVKNYPTYKEIANNESIPLLLNGTNEFRDTEISYSIEDPNLLGNLQVRKQDDQIVMPIKLQPGERTVRMVGEILDCTIYKLKKNELLPEDVTVSYYPNGEPPFGKQNISSELPNESSVFGIKVATWSSDYMADKGQPYEINRKNVTEKGEVINTDLLSYFGEGWAIGSYNRDENKFKIIGYVTDARALEVVNP